MFLRAFKLDCIFVKTPDMLASGVCKNSIAYGLKSNVALNFKMQTCFGLTLTDQLPFLL